MGRLDAEEGLGRDHEGPQVEAAFAARNPGPVDAHELLDRLDEDGFGQLRHGHAIGGGLEAPRIGVGAEQVHAAVVALVGLEALEDLLRVVQHGARPDRAGNWRAASTRASCQPLACCSGRSPCDR